YDDAETLIDPDLKELIRIIVGLMRLMTKINCFYTEMNGILIMHAMGVLHKDADATTPKPIQPNDTAISRDPLHVGINDVDTVSDGNPLQQSINVGLTATMTVK
ncbi:6884_t:CDS:2, partial [Acaulospora morrowiae]